MSDKLLLKVWANCTEGGATLAILMAIAEASIERGNCYVSLSQLAAAARISRIQAWRAVKELRRSHWIVTSRMEGQGGVLVYQINLPKLERSQREGVDRAAFQAGRSLLQEATQAGAAESVQLGGTPTEEGDTTAEEARAAAEQARAIADVIRHASNVVQARALKKFQVAQQAAKQQAQANDHGS